MAYVRNIIRHLAIHKNKIFDYEVAPSGHFDSPNSLTRDRSVEFERVEYEDVDIDASSFDYCGTVAVAGKIEFEDCGGYRNKVRFGSKSEIESAQVKLTNVKLTGCHFEGLEVILDPEIQIDLRKLEYFNPSGVTWLSLPAE